MVFAAELLGRQRCVGCSTRSGPLCPACRAILRTATGGPAVAGVERVLAPWAYEGAARALVLDLKLRGRRCAAAPLAAAMCDEVAARGLVAQTVTWVPGRRSEAMRRGFDHAELLARSVARRLGLPAARLLERTSPRPDQTRLSAAARQLNLAGAFRALPWRAPVLLVDDLVTTGATASACAKALRAAGSPLIEVLVACRA